MGIFELKTVAPGLNLNPGEIGNLGGVSSSDFLRSRRSSRTMPWLLHIGLVTLMVVALACSKPGSAEEETLQVVELTRARDISCLYRVNCGGLDEVKKATARFSLPEASGQGEVVMSAFTGKQGSPAAGLYGYFITVELGNLQGANQCVRGLIVPLAKTPIPLDYDGNGIASEHVFTSEIPVRQVRATRKGDRLNFDYGSGLCAGIGDATFGFASDQELTRVPVTVVHGEGELQIELDPQPR